MPHGEVSGRFGVLSKSREGEFGLDKIIRSVRRRGIGLVDPGPEIRVDKEIEAKQRHQVREAPGQTAAQLQELQEQDGDQCAPNLDVDGRGGGRE